MASTPIPPTKSNAGEGQPGARRSLRRRLRQWHAALLASVDAAARLTSSVLTNIMGIGIVGVVGLTTVVGARHVDERSGGQSKVQSDAPAIPTRRVITERIVPNTSRPAAPVVGVPEPTPETVVSPGKDKVDAPVVLVPPAVWSELDIATAAAACKVALQAPSIRFVAAPPIRLGPCGDAAPIMLSGAGQPNLSLQPAIAINCRTAGAVDAWVTKVVQPAASEILGSVVVGLIGTSSYVCRNRNGEASGPISEHAFANAFDVASFKLADGRTIDVAVWGATVPKRTEGSAGIKRNATAAPGLSAQPAPVQSTPAVAAGPVDARLTFLKRIHHEACGMFGTVLGPEANEAHREHLHLDMKVRRGHAFCE